MKSPSVYSHAGPVPSLPRGSTSCAWRAKSADTRPLPQGRRPLIPASHHLRRAFPAPFSPAARGRHACPANALSPSRRPRFLFRRLSPPKSLPLSAPSPGRNTHLPGRSGHTECASLPRNHGRAPSLGGRFRHEKPVRLLLPQPCAFSFSGQHFLRMACEVCRLTAASTGQKAAYSGFTPSPPGFSGTVLPCGTRQTRMSGKRAFPFPQAPFLVPPPVSPKKPAPFRSFAGTQHTLARPERTHRMRFPSPKPRKSAFPRRSLPP